MYLCPIMLHAVLDNSQPADLKLNFTMIMRFDSFVAR